MDPRDQRWEVDAPTYRVYFWRGAGGGHGDGDGDGDGEPTGWTSDEWAISEADVDEVLAWADAHAAGRTMTVWVVHRDAGGLGLIRLAGVDPPAAAEVWPVWARPRRG